MTIPAIAPLESPEELSFDAELTWADVETEGVIATLIEVEMEAEVKIGTKDCDTLIEADPDCDTDTDPDTDTDADGETEVDADGLEEAVAEGLTEMIKL